MGRTARVNGNAGRDHWTYCYGMWFAGAGIRGGTVVGESDSQAAYVKDHPISTSDVCATIYERLGIDPEAVQYIDGDTDRVAFGIGTNGSRSTVIAGSALWIAADKIIAKGKKMAAHLLEAAEADD